MKIEKEVVIISGFVGFAIGVCSMMAINIDKEVRQVERFDETKFIIQENINTCKDMIEWMNEDVKDYADSTVFDTYILNLNQMVDCNNYILQTKYDY